jgi:hypothetical protein
MKTRALFGIVVLGVGIAAGMLARDLWPGRPAEAQDAGRPIQYIRFQVTSVPREKGDYSVFVVNQENGDLWRHDSTQAGYVKAAGPIK